jgi:hypothetical protein
MLIFASLTEMQIMKQLLYNIAFSFVLFLASGNLSAQTAKSLFWRSDSLQVSEIVSETGDQYRKVGHHGPAVENTHLALRIYFNDSGAIDLYSKSGRGMELESYLWYPSAEAQETAGAGCDSYIVGKTVGFGGIALWDGENEVKLVATKGRTARVGDTKKGSFAEIISYGVPYKGDSVDISIRIDVTAKSREAVVTATELSGKKVLFLTGVNFHDGQKVTTGKDFISVWGTHPAKELSMPIGAGMKFSDKDFPTMEKTDVMVRVISKPSAQVKTTLVGASVKEAELNSAKRFEAYMIK